MSLAGSSALLLLLHVFLRYLRCGLLGLSLRVLGSDLFLLEQVHFLLLVK